MRLYRCIACHNDQGQPGKDFAADKPTCPDCGSTGPARILERVVIHFEPSARPGVGLRYLACQPSVAVGQGHRFSGLPVAVTCPVCRETQAFKDADAALSFDPALDVPVMVTADGPKAMPGEPQE